MTHEEALMYYHGMLLGAQKARSITAESFGEESDELLAPIATFLFGPGNCVPKLLEVIKKAENSEPINGSDFYNWMLVATRLEPSIGMCAVNFGVVLPEPDFKWFTETWYAV